MSIPAGSECIKVLLLVCVVYAPQIIVLVALSQKYKFEERTTTGQAQALDPTCPGNLFCYLTETYVHEAGFKSLGGSISYLTATAPHVTLLTRQFWRSLESSNVGLVCMYKCMYV